MRGFRSLGVARTDEHGRWQLRPPSWILVPEVTETILHLVNAGHVILVGQGGAFITARMPNVFHVRRSAHEAFSVCGDLFCVCQDRPACPIRHVSRMFLHRLGLCLLQFSPPR